MTTQPKYVTRSMLSLLGMSNSANVRLVPTDQKHVTDHHRIFYLNALPILLLGLKVFGILIFKISICFEENVSESYFVR